MIQVLGGRMLQAGSGQAVDGAGDALGGLKDGQDCIGVEQGLGAAGQFEVVLEVAAGLVAVQANELAPEFHALGQGLQAALADVAGEVGVAAEQQGEDGSGVQIEGGELGRIRPNSPYAEPTIMPSSSGKSGVTERLEGRRSA